MEYIVRLFFVLLQQFFPCYRFDDTPLRWLATTLLMSSHRCRNSRVEASNQARQILALWVGVCLTAIGLIGGDLLGSVVPLGLIDYVFSRDSLLPDSIAKHTDVLA